ncbi:DUF596 domain-containing protein [Yersinia mollaretii]|uniref:DUF596 domain-containing protein n=1 Tax=Yersinia mollaretii TaxID=33060 RepID=UPI0011A4DE32|nr:DUF596 domain-containing protein [Yersinia mollaretii]
MYIGNDEYIEYKNALEGHSIGALWYVTPPDEYCGKEFTFEQRKDFFFMLLHLLMQDGRIKLAKHGVFLDGTIEEQIARYKAAFPKTEQEWKARAEDVWFFDEDCPGGIVWVHDNGYLDWT